MAWQKAQKDLFLNLEHRARNSLLYGGIGLAA